MGSVAVVTMLVWCLVPHPYVTGTDNVAADGYVAPIAAGTPMCVPDLQIPANTAGIQFEVASGTLTRPALRMVAHIGARTVRATLPAAQEPGTLTFAVFPIPQRPSSPAITQSSLCVTADALVNWLGTPTTEDITPPPTSGGAPLVARIAIWYTPKAGAKRSYLSEVGSIFHRAALFRPGIVGAWTYWLIFLLILPGIAFAAVRTLAIAAGGSGRRIAAWVYAIAAINACCWALITPAWMAPDEVDHYAYTQSLVERGQGPIRNPGSAQMRWSTDQQYAMQGTRFFTDHAVNGSRVPWNQYDVNAYEKLAATNGPKDNGGGYTTSAAHGPLYYLALAPAYAATRGSSPFSQLTLMRLSSALIGALAALFAFLIGRELAPRRPWLGVVAALLVAFEPMYSFISGAVNNDVGVIAGAAALLYLLVRMMRRWVSIPLGAATGILLIALPLIKGTGYELYPIAFLAFIFALWRHHTRRDLLGFVALGAGVLLVTELSIHLSGTFHPLSVNAGTGTTASTSVGAVSFAREHIGAYLSYLWQAILPRLPFMSPHFSQPFNAGFNIFVVRGWGAFGWYDTFFPLWVYTSILVVMVATPVAAVVAGWREWTWVRRNWMECVLIILTPCAVIGAFEAAYFTISPRPVIGEFGRYAFPAIVALALLVTGALHAFGRRLMVFAGATLITAVVALCVAGQLVVLTKFYA